MKITVKQFWETLAKTTKGKHKWTIKSDLIRQIRGEAFICPVVAVVKNLFPRKKEVREAISSDAWAMGKIMGLRESFINTVAGAADYVSHYDETQNRMRKRLRKVTY